MSIVLQGSTPAATPGFAAAGAGNSAPGSTERFSVASNLAFGMRTPPSEGGVSLRSLSQVLAC